MSPTGSISSNQTGNQTLSKITAATIRAIPTVTASIQAVELLAGPEHTSGEKAAAAIEAASASLAESGNPNIANLALLTNLIVRVANALGVFQKKKQ